MKPISFPWQQGAGQEGGIHEDQTMPLTKNQTLAVAQPVATDLYNGEITGDVAATLGTPGSSVNASGPTVMQPVAYGVSEQPSVAHCLRSGASKADKHESTTYVAQPVAPSLTASNNPSRSPQSSEVTQQVTAVYDAIMQVRRLTPTECERLQGFPDGWTAIPWRGKPASQCPDGPRYKALGNSMAVPCMRWIGQQLDKVK